MAENDREELQKRVQSFLNDQPLYDPGQPLSVTCDEGDLYYILYGADIAVGVAGFGQTAQGAFNDFIDNWDLYRSIKKS